MKKKNKKIKKRNRWSADSAEFSKSEVVNPNIDLPDNAPLAETDPVKLLDEKYQFVRHDVQRVLLFIGIIAIILVGSYFLNTKTSILNSFGDWIYRIANIQTG